MSALLKRPELFSGRIESFGYEYLSFETRKLAAGRQHAAETGSNELAIVVLGGVCSGGHSAGKLAAYRRTQ
jgi:5-deoxy-D-glucuronate isomerase